MSNTSLGDLLAPKDTPQDGISQLAFSASASDYLLLPSWDRTVRLYDVPSRQTKCIFSQPAPVLTACFQNDGMGYSGGLDGQLRRLNFHNSEEVIVGGHNQAIQAVEFLQERGLVVSGSWDSTLRLWDPRAPPYQTCVAVVNLPGRVYTMSVSATNLVVGTSGRHVLVYDVRRLEAGQPDQTRESSLKYQTRSIAVFPDGTGYALGSVEGRVAIEFLDLSPEAQASKYAFKCHRRTEGTQDIVFPVHAIAYHKGYGTFATGGGDGVVNIWDGSNKKRLFQISRYPTSVSALAFNNSGTLLAVAASYAYESGDKDHPPDAVYIRQMADSEVRPKVKK